jgi:putative ABC transport system permease protein
MNLLVMNFLIAFRNLGRNLRRSAFTLLTIAFGFTAVSLFAGYVHDIYQGLARQAVHGELLGHLQIRMQGDRAQRRLNPEAFVFDGKTLAEISGVIRRDPAVALVTPRLELTGIVSDGRVSTVFIGQGMVPEATRLIRGPLAGSSGDLLPLNGTPAAAVGAGLAEILGIAPGDLAVLVSTTLDGMTNAVDVDIGTVFDTGTEATNERMLLVPLDTAQRLLATDGADRLVVLLRDGAQTAAAAERLRDALAGHGTAVEIQTWQSLSVFYNRVRNLFDMIFVFIFSIVALIVVMSIVNIMSLVVIERTREIGTLRALGMRRAGIVRLFCSEALIVTVLGCVLGAALATVTAGLVNVVDISYVPPNSTSAVPLRVDLQAGTMLATGAVLVALAMLVTLLPARRAARLPITEALGHA